LQSQPKKKNLRFNASQKQIALLIAHYITEGAGNNEVRRFTMQLLADSNVPLQPPSMSQLETIYSFVNKNIAYVSDIANIETLQPAEVTLANKYGDCDCKSILSGAMLKTLGYTVALVFLDVAGLFDYQHIYLWVAFNGKWHAFDTCIESASAGVGSEVKKFKRKLVMPIY
jgi:predicted transglutaminase-like cysteine proteinase